MDRRTARRSGRHTQMAVVAAHEAVASANLRIDETNRDDIGVIIASSGTLFTIGEQEKVIETRGPSRVDPLTVPRVGQYSACRARRPPARGARPQLQRQQRLRLRRRRHRPGAEPDAARLRRVHARRRHRGDDHAASRLRSLAGLGALTKTWNAEPQARLAALRRQAQRLRPRRRRRHPRPRDRGVRARPRRADHLRAGRRRLVLRRHRRHRAGRRRPGPGDVPRPQERRPDPDDIDYINAHGTSTRAQRQDGDRGDQEGLRRARLRRRRSAPPSR